MANLTPATEEIVRKYLQEYALIADQYLQQEDVLQKNFDFFQQFYRRENLERMEWDDFQLMGGHVHAFNSMAIARGNALGRINQPIEKYKEALIYLVYGDDPIGLKINNLKTGNGFSLPYFGKSALSELACYAYPDKYLFINSRDIEAARFLGLNVTYKRGSRAGDKFLAFNTGIEPLFEMYREIVGKRTNTSIPLEVDQFLSWLYSTHIPDEEAVDEEDDETESHERQEDSSTNISFWMYAPGPNGSKWPDFFAKGIMAIDYSLGDLRNITSKAELTVKLQAMTHEDHSHKNHVRGCWDFCHQVKKGDIIITKKGLTTYLGYGIVDSEYIFDNSVQNYQHVRKVRWIIKGEWSTKDGGKLTPKTLTNITRYKKWVESLIQHIGIVLPNETGLATFEESHTEYENKPTDFNRLELLSNIFLEESKIDSIVHELKRKKNVILQGPPGVGKTFVAKRLAYLVMESIDNNFVETIQFHQSYSYEDFIQGYRPTETGGFYLKNGIFYDFCLKAKNDLSHSYFFIIDEINRGNLSKIFGELMMLIEYDKRGPNFSIPLTYSRNRDERFFIPENVHIIGTMNTADRSLAMVDFALRRRFSFIPLIPCFNANFKNSLIGKGVNEAFIDLLVSKIGDLNGLIKDDKNLGEGFLVGHSYFTSLSANAVDDFDRLVDNEIEPLVREYWFDNELKADDVVKKLKTW